MQNVCLLQAYFFYQSQPGSWAKLTDPAFIPALPGPRSILGTAGLRETVPQLPVPSIKPFIPFLFFLWVPGRSWPRREDCFLEGLLCKPDLVAPGCSVYEVLWQGQLMLIACKQLTGQPWYLSAGVAFAFSFYSLKKTPQNLTDKIKQFSNVGFA